MAQLKDLIVTGASQLVGDVNTSQIQISKVKALSTAGGNTYSTGTAGQVLMSNGSNGAYWGTPAASVTESTVSGWGFTKNTGTITGVTADKGLEVSETTIGHSNNITPQSTRAIYPIEIDAQGHITAYDAAVIPLTASSTLDATKLSGTIPANCYTNTTYSSLAAANGGTNVSLVTTGEKYTWNNKSTVSITRDLTSGTKIGTITINGTSTDLYSETNTDTKVTQNAAITTAGEYPVILGNSTATTAITDNVNKTSTLTYNPSTQILTTPNLFAGNIYIGSSSYGSELPSSGTTGQIFFQDDEYNYATQEDLTGFVSGPDSATENSIAIYNGTAGNMIKNSNVTIDSSNNIDTAGALTAKTLYIFGTSTTNKTNRYISSDSAKNMFFVANGITSLVISDTELRTGNSITSGTIDLGNTSRRWKGVYAANVNTTKISIPTAAGGSTYGVGSAGQVITSDGTNTYWATPNQDDILVYNDVTVETSYWTPEDHPNAQAWSSSYPRYATIPCQGVTSDYVPTVIFNYAQLTSDNFAPYAVTKADGNNIFIYAKVVPTESFTIPTIYCVKGSNTITS